MKIKLIAACFAATATLAAPAVAGVNIVDGDTFTIDGQIIRIENIDTPESYHPRCEAELAKALDAKERLRQILGSGEVSVRPIGQDRYGRILAKVFAGGINVGKTLISEGHALPYRSGASAKLDRLQVWCGASAALEDVWDGSAEPLTVVAERKKRSDEQADVRAPFPNCAAARAAGAAPVYAGDPGYQPKLDRDRDGVGCE